LTPKPGTQKTIQYDPANPLIVQSDRTILLDTHAPAANEARAALIPFAELERSPEHLHTYRLTPLSVWNASSAGFSPEHISETLEQFSRYPVPPVISSWVRETAGRSGKLRIIYRDENLYLVTAVLAIFKEIEASKVMAAYIQKAPSFTEGETELYSFALPLIYRGVVKQELLKLGWPVWDEAPLVPGDPLDIALLEQRRSGGAFTIRDYQRDAAAALVGDMRPGSGFGTIVLPCGAGKTIVGMYIMSLLKTNTLILTTNISAVHQWMGELLDKTNLTEDDIGEYTGESKNIKPVTVATYQVITWRPDKEAEFPHFKLFRERAWGLIVYDEVHLLPAPVFRVTAELQAVRRVGLTATLVREDGNEGYVFSLVGPKRFDVPWKDLELSGWIATAECVEIRVDLAPDKEIAYATANLRQKHRIASENPAKTDIVTELVKRNPEDRILIIGQYLNQLEELSRLLSAPIITGKTPNSVRDGIYDSFRRGEIQALVVSKVANFAIDLPDASMAIQISGTFGSRQEEAQRLGRILRPKERTSRFYTIVSRNTVEEEFAANRQKFLAEQGYAYRIVHYHDIDSLE
jgi:DNA excision repair protein ERCC-3